MSDKGDAGLWFRSPYFDDFLGTSTGYFAPLGVNGFSRMHAGSLSVNSIPYPNGRKERRQGDVSQMLLPQYPACKQEKQPSAAVANG